MFATLRVPAIIAIGSLALAGCAGTDIFGAAGTDVTTSSVTQAQAAPKIDPACTTLAQEIDTLRREGVADKVERAAAKKYRMTAADLQKANQLNRANADFQGKCSSLPRTAAAPAPATAPAPAVAAAAKAAQKATTTR